MGERAYTPLPLYQIFHTNVVRFADIQVNYLTIPCYVFGTIYLFFITWLSDKLRKRAVLAIICPWIAIVGYAIAIATPNVGAGYFAMFLVSGSMFSFPICSLPLPH